MPECRLSREGEAVNRNFGIAETGFAPGRSARLQPPSQLFTGTARQARWRSCLRDGQDGRSSGESRRRIASLEVQRRHSARGDDNSARTQATHV